MLLALEKIYKHSGVGMQRLSVGFCVGASLCVCASAFAADLQTQAVQVIGITPTLGTGIDKDKVPTNVQNFNVGDITPGQPQTIEDVLNRRMGSISTSDYNGSTYQAGLSFRGYNASPIIGDPQGLAVYQNGMRVNESFGDIVNWDMIPVFAIHQMEMLPGASPVFGLNALGGAISMGMKNGFNTKGTTIDVSGGTYGREKVTAETARTYEGFGFYTGVSAMNDFGWRRNSPTQIAQNYTDVAWRGDTSEMGAGVTLAGSFLSNLGSLPDELRTQSRSNYFTGPDNQRNSVAAIDLRGNHDFGDDLSGQVSLYYRHLRTAVTNGNTSNNTACGDGTLCGSDGATKVVDLNGNTIPDSNTYVINKTLTLTDGYGISAQVTYEGKAFGLDNTAIFGSSFDAGDTQYISVQEAGVLDSERLVVGSGQVIGGTANYVSLLAHNIYTGVYATDVMTVLPSVTMTVSARYNTAVINMHDQVGESLNATHYYDRLNPAGGLAWKVNPKLTVFGNYSEANRIPTAAELSCADPNNSCFVPNAFQSDPSLAQVVSRSWESGARGNMGNWGNWSTTAFFTRNANDIYFVGDSTGKGYFRNIGNTQRMGFEGNLDGHYDDWGWFASYTLLRATFDSPMTVGSRSPTSNSNTIYVTPGKVMPGSPMHSLKVGGSYQVCSDFAVGADAIVKSGVYLRGDENNTQPTTNPYAVFNVDATWKATEWLAVYFRGNNIFNQKYETAGQYADATNVFSGFSTQDRYLTSGMPSNFWLGTRITF